MDIREITTLVSLAIKWIPLIILFVLVLFGFVKGFVRGKRKSKMAFRRSFIIFTIFFILYLLLCETSFGDKLLYTIVNLIYGGEFTVRIGLSGRYNSMSSVLSVYIPYLIEQYDILSINGISEVLIDNGGYINSLVNFIYHIFYGIIFFTLYKVFDFFGWLFMFIFKSEHKAMRKQNERFKNGKEFSTYRKGKLAGAFYGAFKGLITSLIILSFIGSFLFCISGDKGDGKLKEVDTSSYATDETTECVIEIYKTIDSYGENGVFKALNFFTVNNGEPLYLAIPDLIFSGKDTNKDSDEYDYSFSVSECIYPFVSFAKETIISVDSFSTEETRRNAQGEGAENVVSEYSNILFTNAEAQASLIELVDSFPSSSYIINLLMNFINSGLSNLSLTDLLKATGSNIDERILEPINILLYNGHYSPYIEEEVKLKNSGCTTPLPSITVDDIIDINQLSSILSSVFNYLTLTDGEISSMGESFNPDDILNYIDIVITGINALPLFEEERSERVNSSLTRVFYYLKSMIKEADLSSILSKRYASNESEITYDSYIASLKNTIDWTGEVKNILNYAHSVVDVVKVFMNFSEEYPEGGLANMIQYFAIDNYDKIFNVLDYFYSIFYDSNIIGEILNVKEIKDKIIEFMNSETLFNGSFYIYEDMAFTNVYNADGSIKQRGELYKLLKSTLSILNKENVNSFMELCVVFGLDSSGEIKEMLKDKNINVSDALFSFLTSEDEDGYNMIDYLKSSDLLRSIASALLFSKLSDKVYISDSLKEISDDGDTLSIIKKSELDTLFDSIMLFVTDEKLKKDLNIILATYGIGETDTTEEEVNLIDTIFDLMDSNSINKILDSKILQGTLGSLLLLEYSKEDSELKMLAIPKELMNPEGWIDTDYNESEVKTIFKSIKLLNIESFDFTPEKILNMIVTSKDPNKVVEYLLASDILYYTVSSLFPSIILSLNNEKDSQFTLSIPDSVIEKLPDTETIPYLIKKTEIVNLFKAFTQMGIIDDGIKTSGLDLDKVLTNIILNKDEILKSHIVVTCIINLLSDKLKDNKQQSLLSTELNAASKQALPRSSNDVTSSFTLDNIWYIEINDLFNVIEEIYSPSIDNPLTILSNGFDYNDLVDKVKNIFAEYDKPSNVNKEITKFDLLFSSKVITNVASNYINTEVLTSSMIDPTVKERAMQNGIIKITELKSMFNFLKSIGFDFVEFALPPVNEMIIPSIIEGLDSGEGLYLIRGILTKKIEENVFKDNDDIVVLNSAYESNELHILTKSEISSFLTFIGGKKFSEFKLENIKLIDIVNSIYDSETHVCKSYILLGSISKALLNKADIFGQIPMVIVKEELHGSEKVQYITKEEIYKLFNTIFDIAPNVKIVKDLSDSSKFSYTILKNNIVINKELLDSKIINAFFLNILDFGSGMTVYVKNDLIDYSLDTKGNKVIMLKSSEATALCESLLLLSGDGKLFDENGNSKINNFMGKFIEIGSDAEKMETLLSSNIVKNLINVSIDANYDGAVIVVPVLPPEFIYEESEYVFKLAKDVEKREYLWKTFFSKDDLPRAYNAIQTLSNNS